MEVSLQELADRVGGRIRGDGSTRITGAATLPFVTAGQITFLDGATSLKLLTERHPAAVVVSDVSVSDLSLLIVDDVHAAFAQIVRWFRPAKRAATAGVSTLSYVSPSARLGRNVCLHNSVTVGDDVVIGDNVTLYPGVRVHSGCRLGDDVTLFSNVVLYEDTVVGPRSTIHANAVIGAYGFGYQMIAGQHLRAAQLGSVEIGADVEIGAGTTIDRGTYDATVIGDGTKIDNLVMIAHNCRLGRHNIICSQVGIAGSCSTGDYVVMAGQVGLCDHVEIGDHAVLGAKAGVMNSVPPGEVHIGIPAMRERDYWRRWISAGKTAEIQRQLRSLKEDVEALTKAQCPSSRTDAA